MRDMVVDEHVVNQIKDLAERLKPRWIVTVKRRRRSTNANARYWALLNEAAEQMNMESEELHDVCRHLFLGYFEADLPGGRRCRILKHTRNLDSKQFSEYMQEVEAHMVSEWNVQLADQRGYQ